MKFVEYPDREMMMINLAHQLAGELNNTLMAHERATFAVPGGTTPGPVFDALSGADLHWDRISVLLTDERWVPEDHGRSNTRLVRKRLLTSRAAMAELVPLYADTETPEEVIDQLAEGVRKVLPISVLLLGMGGDAHIASLFPGADNLEAALASDAPPLMAMRAEGAGEPRITLTAPVLQSAMSTHIVITGPEKRATLERAKTADPKDAPVRAVWSEATVHWAE
jgi:6-phosphogluconolactonase